MVKMSTERPSCWHGNVLMVWCGKMYILVFVCVQVWAVDLQKNEKVVKDVILVAQGEMALEEFLKMVCKLQDHC